MSHLIMCIRNPICNSRLCSACSACMLSVMQAFSTSGDQFTVSQNMSPYPG